MEARIRCIVARHGRDLLDAALRREPASFATADANAEALVGYFAAADPSANKSCTQWLVRTYLTEGFRLEDLGKAHGTLAVFLRNKRKLPPQFRDLNRYATLADLWTATKPFDEPDRVPEGREARRLERLLARAESRILRETDDGFTVAVPLTIGASRYWGRGTRWCTAARENCAFDTYNDSAPLVMIILPGGRKLQFFASATTVQFMDDNDAAIRPKEMSAIWPYVRPIVEWGLTINGDCLSLIPMKFRDVETCLIAVSKNGKALRFVPKYLRTRELCEIAVGQNGAALEHVRKPLRRAAIALAAVTSRGWALDHVPRRFRSRTICEAAVNQTGMALRYVPAEFRDDRMIDRAITSSSLAIDTIPEEQRTRDRYGLAVERCGGTISRVPRDMLDRELIVSAMRTNEHAHIYVPETMWDEELCRTAVTSSRLALFRIPSRFMSRSLCELAVRHHAGAIVFVPPEFYDRDMHVIAASHGGNKKSAILPTFQGHNLSDQAILKNADMLRSIGGATLYYTLCQTQLSNPDLLPSAPADLMRNLVVQEDWGTESRNIGAKWSPGLLHDLQTRLAAPPRGGRDVVERRRRRLLDRVVALLRGTAVPGWLRNTASQQT